MGGVYIAGPMRGVEHFGFDAFFDAEEWLREHTCANPIFNPARRDEGLGFKARAWELTGDEDLTQRVFPKCAVESMPESDLDHYYEGFQFDLAAAMEADNDFIRSDECDTIVMLPGWGQSVGARDELHLAESLGRDVFYLYGGAGDYLLSVSPRWEDRRAARGEAESDRQRRLKAALDDALAAEPSEHVLPAAALDEVRVTSETGGAKGMKPERHELIPGQAMDAVARVYAFGAKKYDADNWRRGYPWRLSLGALFRHVNAVRKGQWLDPESSEPHLAHAVFHCLTMMQWWYDRNTAQNDIHGLELPEVAP